MTDSVRDDLKASLKAIGGLQLCGDSLSIHDDCAEQVAQNIIDALKAACLTITDAARLAELEAAAVWNTDMDAAPKDGTHLLLAFSDGEVWTGGYSEHDNGWMTGCAGYPMVDNTMDDAHKCLLLIVAWKPITPHDGG